MSPLPSPETVVQRQLDAYNARDIEALLAIYADDAQTFEHPATLLASGSAALRERFLVRFQEQNLYAALLQRIVMGNIVVDHERVTRTFAEGPGKIELTMIYEVQDGRISKAWTIAGAKTLDAQS
ncbi:nuclear transport factor 2 family protein [Paraherbaspirillum soli]|uniref:Nuclear transport factor 2 family protein n=1 Tax=Paraherbaspirillum soli TaxID=631222 RepID=A0ABW0MDB2_9BURK